MRHSEVIMEKQQASSLTRNKLHHIGSKLYSAVPLANGGSSEAPEQLSREEVSRCIVIWATFYCHKDDKPGERKLCLPPGPWTERS